MGRQKRRGAERGAAEERSGVPLTEAEMRASERPPGEPRHGEARDRAADPPFDDNAGMAGGASGSSGGGASTPGHPDTAS